MLTRPPAILILGNGSLKTARHIRDACPGAAVHGLSGRVAGADVAFANFGAAIRELFAADVPIVALCAAGIVIRALAPLLQNKRAEPPVLAVAEDGSAVVPLLGGLRGVNALARRLGEALATVPAITTTGELRFALALENPPAGYVLRNPEDGKRFMSDLLAGEAVRVEGNAFWLDATRLPRSPEGRLSITVTCRDRAPAAGELVFHPRSVVVGVSAGDDALAKRVAAALATAELSVQSVAFLVASEADAARSEILAAAAALGQPLRLAAVDDGVPGTSVAGRLVRAAVPEPAEAVLEDGPVAVAVAGAPDAVLRVGRARGRLAIVGLGPGDAATMTPAVREELRRADDVVGYETYVRMAGPFRPDQTVHASDNRVEMDRARHAFALAAQGRSVAVVSSGDPGVFAMATAVLEALHGSDDPAWHGVELAVLPGVSAAHAAAARAGAPLGHDFCVLSDNLKPWEIVEQRLEHAAAADLALALYNPISTARPWQLGRALEVLRRHRTPDTPVVLGRDIGRPAERLTTTTLGRLRPEAVDMRTVVLVGSSATRAFGRADGGAWVYTPRWYGTPPEPLTPG